VQFDLCLVSEYRLFRWIWCLYFLSYSRRISLQLYMCIPQISTLKNETKNCSEIFVSVNKITWRHNVVEYKLVGEEFWNFIGLTQVQILLLVIQAVCLVNIGSRTPKGIPQILIPWAVMTMAALNTNCELLKNYSYALKFPSICTNNLKFFFNTEKTFAFEIFMWSPILQPSPFCRPRQQHHSSYAAAIIYFFLIMGKKCLQLI